MLGTTEVSFIFGIVIGYMSLGTTFAHTSSFPVIFADETTVIISSTNCDGF
jgi:hypothetical protein